MQGTWQNYFTKLVICYISCSFLKEIEEDNIDKSSAYMLLYEREGLSVSSYLPEIDPER